MYYDVELRKAEIKLDVKLSMSANDWELYTVGNPVPKTEDGKTPARVAKEMNSIVARELRKGVSLGGNSFEQVIDNIQEEWRRRGFSRVGALDTEPRAVLRSMMRSIGEKLAKAMSVGDYY